MVEIAILVNTRIVVISKAWMRGSIGVRGTGGVHELLPATPTPEFCDVM